MSGSLPLAGDERPERSDAAENRRRVLDAAARLFAREVPSSVTMEAVAAEAGVGKGTVFRRFGDRASLARALVSDREAQLQEAMIRGAPPLGPGAPARERLIAFGTSYLDFLEEHAVLLIEAEASLSARLDSTVYAIYRTHLSMLLSEAGCGGRAPYLADVLLAPLAAPTYAYHRRTRELSLRELQDAYADLVARLLDSRP
ncbi:MAG TPA: TetR/AcrR family transcriptional regulator [Solirubrobacter sp.]|nr:TetR/AcrR family transcriptional regulator [Solirubrobacter sp.]